MSENQLEESQESKINILHQILGYTTEVVVNGVKVKVSSPSYQDARSIRSALKELPKPGDDIDPDKAMEANLKVVSMCVRACVKDQGIDSQEAAEHLYMLSGGDNGRLASECYTRCGLAEASKATLELQKEATATLETPS